MGIEHDKDFRVAPPERLADRLAARLTPGHLDVALANGTPPETNAALALRARRLARLQRRRALAGTVRRIVGDPGRGPLRAGPIRGRVSAASEELAALAGALAQPDPVSPRGVAQTVLLLTDGAGPLYNPASRASVADRAATATANLRLA
jgi:hypothetical protein